MRFDVLLYVPLFLGNMSLLPEQTAEFVFSFFFFFMQIWKDGSQTLNLRFKCHSVPILSEYAS